MSKCFSNSPQQISALQPEGSEGSRPYKYIMEHYSDHSNNDSRTGNDSRYSAMEGSWSSSLHDSNNSSQNTNNNQHQHNHNGKNSNTTTPQSIARITTKSTPTLEDVERVLGVGPNTAAHVANMYKIALSPSNSSYRPPHQYVD